jgi:hypothetical protein
MVDRGMGRRGKGLDKQIKKITNNIKKNKYDTIF